MPSLAKTLVAVGSNFMDNFQIALFISGLVFTTGLFGLIRRIRFGGQVTVNIKRIFITLSLLLLLATALAQFDTYFRGYWTTKVIICTFLFLGSVLFAFGDRQFLSKPLRVLLASIFYFPLFSFLIFFLLDFLGRVLVITIWGHLLGDAQDIYYKDDEIRLQRVFRGALGATGPPYLFHKSGALEFNEGPLAVNYYEQPDSIGVEKTKDSVTLYIYHNDTYDTINPVTIKLKR